MEKLSIDWTGDIAEIQVDPCRNAVIVLHSDNLGIIVPHIQAYFFSVLLLCIALTLSAISLLILCMALSQTFEVITPQVTFAPQSYAKTQKLTVTFPEISHF